MNRRQTVGGAHRSDTATGRDFESALGVEAFVVVDEDSRARVPRREEPAPGVLGPSRRADVQVDIVGSDANPVHGSEVADGIALVSMQNQLRQGGRARGEMGNMKGSVALVPPSAVKSGLCS